MDKSILKQLMSLVLEIEDEKKRIQKLQDEIDRTRPDVREVSDIVSEGKRGKKSLGTCKIHGFEDHNKRNKKLRTLRRRKAIKELHTVELEEMVVQAEEYIYSTDDSELRRILEFYCIDRKNWKEVAEEMGEGYTAEACKQAYSRFMRSK